MLTDTKTAIAAPEPPITANVRDLKLFIVTEENQALLPDSKIGDIYKVIIMPSGAAAFVPLRAVPAEEVLDRAVDHGAAGMKNLLTLTPRINLG